jgi:hypothetical protein
VAVALADPVESIVEIALQSAGYEYVTDFNGGNPTGLDFYLPGYDLHIEVKQFHSPRISEQMSRAPNVIAIQGIEAARWFAGLLK